MDHADAVAFADDWVQAWNSHDLEKVLSFAVRLRWVRATESEAWTTSGTVSGMILRICPIT